MADEIGTWNVSYQKGGQELESIQVRVRLSDQDLVDLSQAVELPKNDVRLPRLLLRLPRRRPRLPKRLPGCPQEAIAD